MSGSTHNCKNCSPADNSANLITTSVVVVVVVVVVAAVVVAAVVAVVAVVAAAVAAGVVVVLFVSVTGIFDPALILSPFECNTLQHSNTTSFP